MGCQELMAIYNNIKETAIGYTKQGRALLDSQEHIFTETFSEMEVLTAEQKLAILQKKYFQKY